MKITDQRLEEIIRQLQHGPDLSSVSATEWQSMAVELMQLRLRTSSQTRTATAGSRTAA